MTVQERTAAVYVMQRFVRMSRLLLPTYSTLLNKKDLSEKDYKNIEGICSVYDNFHADPQASNLLINSNILALIQKVYRWLRIQKGVNTPQSFYDYQSFIKESDRLIEEWDYQLLN